MKLKWSTEKRRISELTPYCDVIIKRWQDYAGKEAIHENGKKYNDL